MSRFAGLKKTVAPSVVEPAAQTVVEKARPRNPREGKRAVVGYFSPAVSRGLHQLALDTDTTIQGLIGEAIDDLMRKHGRHPFGER
ncbi:ribbon-helix-helix domain-containing protein [Acetobacter malorum]|uniref:ribbon-helix-helix domain-containing protein n=1 Tax=Acetobacter malorum TaxID=178901 RepID=UPI0009ED5803|nr:ribbon-helix-helix domain-containing protein [Acetobacter malorum]